MSRQISRFAHTLLLATGLASAAIAQQPAGVQLRNMDHSVKPGDDFYLFANGEWQKKTEVPADRTSVGSFTIVGDKTDAQLKEIFADLAKNPGTAGSETHKVSDLYASYMDEAAIERNGLNGFKAKFGFLATINTRAELANALGLSLRADTDALNNTQFHTANIFGLWVAPGFNDPDHYAPYLMQGGGGLPSRDYYLSDSPKMKSVREAYARHAAKMFELAGFSDAEARATRVLALETAIARVQISLADSEDITKANNLWSASDFASKAPGLDWKVFFQAAGLAQQKQFYVWQPSAIVAESALVASEPIQSWKDLLLLHTLDAHATGLSKALADERFAFYGTVLTGAPQQRPREQRAVAFANGAMGDAVGQIYVKRYFSAEAKQRAQVMVANLLMAFHKRLEVLDWMTPETKAEAIKKLDALKVGVGYPDHWRTFAGLEVKPDDLAGNTYRANLFDYRYNLSRIGKPVDRAEWCMEPQLVNAVNLPLDNGLNFPAAILQPPFFDASAPDAYNYGAIGHEISHTFDSEGAAFDSTGKVRDWWTPADFAHFKQVTDALAAQFDGYEPFPGIHVNGRQTLGEDIADLGGVAASYDAFHASLKGKPAPVQAVPGAAGLNGDQQFFLAFAQIWRSKMREATERARVLTDPHAPGEYRAETVRNFDAWYKAFDVEPGGKLYLTPDHRVGIW